MSNSVVLEVVGDKYKIFDDFYFLDILTEKDGFIYECSIVEPLISEILNAKLPYTVGSGTQQLKLF